jgi:PhnB protein
MTTLTPMLTVRNAAQAIDFYKRAFGAVVAEMSIDARSFFVVDENLQAFNMSPAALAGTTVRISLIVDDPDALTKRALSAGASEVFPIADQPYGLRQGRVQDPYGHHWLIGKRLVRS